MSVPLVEAQEHGRLLMRDRVRKAKLGGQMLGRGAECFLFDVVVEPTVSSSIYFYFASSEVKVKRLHGSSLLYFH